MACWRVWNRREWTSSVFKVPQKLSMGGIVIAVATPGHGWLEAVLVETLLVVPRAILAAAIRVTDQSRPGTAGLQRLF